MKTIKELKTPINIDEFKKCDKILVFDDLFGDVLCQDNYVKTYIYDKQTDTAYLKRDFVRMSGKRGSGCNFSNSKVSLKDVVDSINWHVKNGEKVEVYFDDML